MTTPRPYPIPADEALRLQTLQSYDILDTPNEAAFDGLVRLAALICQTPIALITLVDETRQWFKAAVGLGIRETSRDAAFCAHAIVRDGTMVVTDALADERFAHNPLVLGDPYIRFYAGSPIKAANDMNLGTLCVIDRKPRTLTADQLASLEILSRQVRDELDLRKRLLELRQSEERTRAIIRNLLGGLIVVGMNGIIESINPAAERIFGYTAEELVGQPVALLVPGDVGDPQEFLRVSHRQAIGRVTEWRGRRKNGEEFPFELSMTEFKIGEERYFAGNIRDISERRAVEKLKKEFIATVSHELRTPLTAIRGSIGLLAGGVLGELPPPARSAVAIADRNTQRLLELINDILDFERLESGRMDLHLAPQPLRPVVEQALEGVRPLADQHGISFELSGDDVEVMADAFRIGQVVVNLVSNAVKFSPPHTTVKVSISANDGKATVRVEDRGRGIPAGQVEKVFERFRQVEASDSRSKGGTGLGLAISKTIVEQHGGTIGVDSVESRGSSFWFTVPIAAKP